MVLVVFADVEIDAALATAPNGALFGSSSVRSPFQVGLWVWNAFVGSDDGFSKWMLSSFGSRPVLLSWVNPALRASVAQEVLRAHGYFHGKVGYDIIKQHNPKKAKIKYTVDMGPLWTVDSLSYQGFPPQADSLINIAYKNHDYDSLIILADSMQKTGALSDMKACYWRGYAFSRQQKMRLAESNWQYVTVNLYCFKALRLSPRLFYTLLSPAPALLQCIPDGYRRPCGNPLSYLYQRYEPLQRGCPLP